MSKNKLEKLAALEHEQWMRWSKSIANILEKAKDIIVELASSNVSPVKAKEYLEFVAELDEKLHKWQQLWVPYENLNENDKNLDREWAKKIIEIMEEL